MTAAVEQALMASPIEGIAEDPQPRCVILDFHPQYVQYGALIWLMRPGMEFVDSSRVRTRITFRSFPAWGAADSISHVLDLRRLGGAQESPEAETDGSLRRAARRGDSAYVSTRMRQRQLASRMKKESFAAGEVILRQGDQGDSLYILTRGRVRSC